VSILSQSVVLVGPGRAGRAFARSWIGAGGRIAGIVVRASGSQAPDAVSGAKVYNAEDASLPSCDLAILAVPDDAIAAVAEALGGRLSCRFAFHLSGALSSDALAAFRRHGAAVASLHPVRPFTGSAGEDWRGAFIAVEGDDLAAAAAIEIARTLGAQPHRLEASEKPLYHAAASLAAGGTAAVISVAVRAWVAAGIPEDVAREALAGLASRAAAAVQAGPFADAMTGAVARRDVGTVRAHAATLAASPDALLLYRLLAGEILARTDGRGREEEIRRLLADQTRPR
jgi:predicted short-subunit dehydrogenase-like oxidoreductase (DUF2520 family)